MINATLNGTTLEDVKNIPIKNSEGRLIDTIVLDEVVTEGSSGMLGKFTKYKPVTMTSFGSGSFGANGLFADTGETKEPSLIIINSDVSTNGHISKFIVSKETSCGVYKGINGMNQNTSPQVCANYAYNDRISSDNLVNTGLSNANAGYNGGKILILRHSGNLEWSNDVTYIADCYWE